MIFTHQTANISMLLVGKKRDELAASFPFWNEFHEWLGRIIQGDDERSSSDWACRLVEACCDIDLVEGANRFVVNPTGTGATRPSVDSWLSNAVRSLRIRLDTDKNRTDATHVSECCAISYYLAHAGYITGRFRDALLACEVLSTCLAALTKTRSTDLPRVDAMYFLAHSLTLEVIFHEGVQQHDAILSAGDTTGSVIPPSSALEQRLVRLRSVPRWHEYATGIEQCLSPEAQAQLEEVFTGMPVSTIVDTIMSRYWPTLPIGLFPVETAEAVARAPLLGPLYACAELRRVFRAFQSRDARFEADVGVAIKKVTTLREGEALSATSFNHVMGQLTIMQGRWASDVCGDLRGGKSQLYSGKQLLRGVPSHFVRLKLMRYRAENDRKRNATRAAEKRFIQVARAGSANDYFHDAAVAEIELAGIWSAIGYQRASIRNIHSAISRLSGLQSFDRVTNALYLLALSAARHRRLPGCEPPSSHLADAALDFYLALRAPTHSTKGVGQRLTPYIKCMAKDYGWNRKRALPEIRLRLRMRTPPTAAWLAELKTEWQDVRTRTDPRPDEAWLPIVGALIALQLEQSYELICTDWRADNIRFKAGLRFCLAMALVASVSAGGPEVRRWLDRVASHMEEIRLVGGLCPIIMELSECFANRDIFISAILALMNALESLALSGRYNSGIREAADGLTRYLPIERNYYLCNPHFSDVPESFRKRGKRELATPSGMFEEYTGRLFRGVGGSLGECHPPKSFGIGWVEWVVGPTAGIKVIWIEDVDLANKASKETVQEEVFATDEIARGRVSEAMTPVGLFYRQRCGDEDKDRGRWVVHALPDIAENELFEASDTQASGWQPKWDCWTTLARRLHVGIHKHFLSKESAIADQYAINLFGSLAIGRAESQSPQRWEEGGINTIDSLRARLEAVGRGRGAAPRRAWEDTHHFIYGEDSPRADHDLSDESEALAST